MPETLAHPLKGERGTRAPLTESPPPRRRPSLEDAVPLSEWPAPEDRDWDFWEETLAHFHNKMVSMIQTAGLRRRQDDILQDIGMKIYERMDRLPPLPSPYTIIRVIAQSVIRDYRRRGRASPDSLDAQEAIEEIQSPYPEAEADLELMADITRAWQLLRGLPAVERICFEMKYFGRYTVADIARIRQMRPEAVKRAISRAISKMTEYYRASETRGENPCRKTGFAVWNPCFIADPPPGVAIIHGPNGRVLLSNPGGKDPNLFLRRCTTCKRICTSHPK